MTKYYIDTCIWIDYFENRKDKFRPLGEWALELINKIIYEEDYFVFSEVVFIELKKYVSEEQINGLNRIIPENLIIKVQISKKDKRVAYILSKQKRICFFDALHAVLAQKENAVLVSRDKHFFELEFVNVKKPEELF